MRGGAAAWTTARATGPPAVQCLRDLLEVQATRWPHRPLVTLDGVTLSYSEVDAAANRAANLLLGLGHSSGDLVVARCGNGLPLLVTWLGCVKAGMVFVPVNPLLEGDPLRAVLADVGPLSIICEVPLLPAVLSVIPGVPTVRRILVADAPGTARGDGHGSRGWRRLLEAPAVRPPVELEPWQASCAGASPAPPPSLPDDPGAPAKLMYTSGTTGEAKGVLWSRRCEVTHAVAYGQELLPIAPGEALYCCLPLVHVTAQGTFGAALTRGGRITIDRRFDPFCFWDRVRAAEAVAFPHVGTLLATLCRTGPPTPDAAPLVRWIMGSGAPVDVWRALEHRLGVLLIETWGQTESASCWMVPGTLPQRPGTVGHPSPRFEARLTDDRGHEAAPGEPGELWIRPLEPGVMFDGYRGGGRLTRESWTADGWYRTGDRLRQEPDGAYAFTGRQRETVRRRGEMVATAAIERAALACPGVGEAAAVGVPADRPGDEEVLLVVAPLPGCRLVAGDVWAALRLTLPRFMLPRYVRVMAELPKTATTRVRKVRLAADGSRGAWDARRARSR